MKKKIVCVYVLFVRSPNRKLGQFYFNLLDRQQIKKYLFFWLVLASAATVEHDLSAKKQILFEYQMAIEWFADNKIFLIMTDVPKSNTLHFKITSHFCFVRHFHFIRKIFMRYAFF